MRLNLLFATGGLAVAAALGGCASGNGLDLTTASISGAEKTAAKPTVDPACVTLAAKINEARAEGTPERVAKVATAENKSRIVNIKRTSLAKVTELDALNREFQARCSTVPTTTASLAAPAAPNAKATAAAKAATKAAAAANEAADAAAAAKTAAVEAKSVTTRSVTTQPIVATPASN